MKQHTHIPCSLPLRPRIRDDRGEGRCVVVLRNASDHHLVSSDQASSGKFARGQLVHHILLICCCIR